MADIAKLGIEVTSKGIDAAKRKLHQLSETADDTENSTNSLTDSFSGLKKAAGALVGALAVREIADLGLTFVKTASDAKETQNKFSVVFSSIRDEAETTADVLEQSYGMSDKAAKESLSAVGDLLTGLNLQQKASLDLANQTVQLGTDLASFTNYVGGAQGATEALTKALLGETEQAKSLGLVLNETQMDAYAASVGKSWKELNLAEKAQLRLNAAIAQSPNAVGDFARSSGELANQMRIADAIMQDMRKNVGDGLLPSFKDAVKAFTSSREGLNDFSIVIGGVFSDSLTGATGILSAFVDETGKIKTQEMSEGFIQAAGAARLLAAGVEAGWIMVKQAVGDFKDFITLDFFNTDKIKEDANKFTTALFAVSDKTVVAWEMMTDPAKTFRKELDEARIAAAEAEEAFKNIASDDGGETGTSKAVQVTKSYTNALQQVKDKLFEVSHTAQQNEIYQINQWYNARAAIIGYTDELVKARELEIQQVIKTYDDREAKKRIAAEKTAQQAILNSEIATAQERIAIINSMYDSKVAAAEQYGVSIVGIEAERSLKIQEIWDKEKIVHGDMLDGFVSGLNKFGDEAQTEYQRSEAAGLAMARSLEGGIGSMLSVTGKGFEDWGDKVLNILGNIIDAIVQAAIVAPLAQGITGAFGSMFSGSGSYNVGGASGTSTGTGGGYNIGGGAVTGLDVGGVFPAGDISNYSGTVVTTPTYFNGPQNKAYATGGNVMGEAGPEAILPLTRTSGGKLGVQAINGSTGDITVNIINEGAPVEAETNQSQDSRGGNILDILIRPIKKEIASDMATNGSMLNKAAKTAVGVTDSARAGMRRGF